jgi:hypothetical protein
VNSIDSVTSIAVDVEVEAMRPCRAAGDVGGGSANSIDMQLTWTFRVGTDPRAEWSWPALGAPPLSRLAPVRQPRSSEHNRHVPVTAYSMTNSDFVSLESGLEHDLVRRLDRDQAVLSRAATSLIC